MIPGHTRDGVLTEATNDYAGPILPGFRETAWIQKSPYFHRAAKYGVRAYDLYNHMLMPGLYTDPVDEYWHLVNHVTLWDVGVERQVEIDGPDGFEFMQMLTPRDMEKCADGLERGARLRAVLARFKVRRETLGRGHGRRGAVRHPSDRPVGDSSDRGGHPELQFGHHARQQPVRGRSRMDRGRRQEIGLSRQSRPGPNQGGGREAEARRDRGRRLAARSLDPGLLGRPLGRPEGRPRHLVDVLAAAREEYRLCAPGHRSREDRHQAARVDDERDPRCHSGEEAVRRPEEGHSEVVKSPAVKVEVARVPSVRR